MQKIELTITALSHSVTQSSNYAVVLGEVDGRRRLPIVIGSFEAQAIAVALEQMIPNRPLTHDLFKSTLEAAHVKLKEIVINNLLDGVFYARIVCAIPNGETFEVDSRTSDAVAMAVRFRCPIYTYDFILEAAGVVLEDIVYEEEKANVSVDSGKVEPPDAKSMDKMNIEELNNKLKEVLEKEDYELAAKIRDEIKKREAAG